jgi:DNA-binding transcriptional ArsR family regulator
MDEQHAHLIENTREAIEAGVFCDRTHIGPAPKQMPSPAEADIAPSRWAATDGRDPQPRAAVRMNEGNGFDELIHPATRLSIVALLAAADWADFAFVRDKLGLSDSALSKQLSTLDEAGYVTIDRPLSGRPPPRPRPADALGPRTLCGACRRPPRDHRGLCQERLCRTLRACTDRTSEPTEARQRRRSRSQASL